LARQPALERILWSASLIKKIEDYMTFMLAFMLSVFLSLLFTPIVTHMAKKKGWFDSVGERKIHTGNIPRLGGMAISLGFFISFFLALLIINGIKPGTLQPDLRFFVLIAAGYGFHILGLVDDFKNLRGRVKFLVQFLLAIAIVASGYYIRSVEIPVEPFRIDLGFWGPILTVIWIVGVTNALNLMDGMDGMASGVAFIGALVWTAVYLKTGQQLPALVALSMAGAIFGFLFFNFPPANIFMGDSGSLFLGFILSVLPLLGNSEAQMQTGLVPAITICLIPILDTFAAMIRRWRRGVSFFTPDKYHLHHKLLNLGFSPRQILAIIYSLCALLGCSVLVGVYVEPRLSFWLMTGAWAAFGAIFVLLHFLKEKKVRFSWNEPQDSSGE
jgi:UDP-GlcNAc:undecaprenyl-phosphate GlcNAc-1-phosphate transferase